MSIVAALSRRLTIPAALFVASLAAGCDPCVNPLAFGSGSCDAERLDEQPVIVGQDGPLELVEDTSLTLGVLMLRVEDHDNTFPNDFTLAVHPGEHYTADGLTITPELDYHGSLDIVVSVNDGLRDSETFTLVATVTPVNDPPVITGQRALAVSEGEAFTLSLADVTVRDPDAAAFALSLVVLDGPGYTHQGLTVTPAAQLGGDLAVVVAASDGETQGPSYTLLVTVGSVDDPPVVTGQIALSVAEDQPFTPHLADLTVVDPDDGPAALTLVLLDGEGYTHDATTVTFPADFAGPATVRVAVSDGTSASAPFDLAVLVTPVNDPPRVVAQAAALTTPEDTPIALALAAVTVVDPDDLSATLTLAVVDGAGYAHAGNLVTPARDFAGTMTVTVTVSDGQATSDAYPLVVTVTPVNDAPVITTALSVTTPEDTGRTLRLADVVVVDPDSTAFTLVVGDGASYTRAGDTITPAADFAGTLHVPVQVSDGQATSAVFDLVVEVTPVNDAPVIAGQLPVEALEDTSVTLTLAHLTVTDPDDTSFTLTVADGAGYSHAGSVITPAVNFTGTLSVPVTVSDGRATSDVFALQVTVTAVNDAPVVTGQAVASTLEETSFVVTLASLSVTDSDDATGFTLAVLDGVGYSHTGDTVTPAVDFNGTLTVPVTVSDGRATSQPFPFLLAVTPVNDPPVITGQTLTPLHVSESTARTIDLADLVITDPDDTLPGHLTLAVGDGTHYTRAGTTITPDVGYAGPLTVPVAVNDGEADSNTYSLLVQIDAINDPPAVVGQHPVSTAEDTALTVTLGDVLVSDPDSTFPADFTLAVLDGAGYGHVGNVVTPALDFNGTMTVRVLVNDGLSDSAAFDLQVTVTPVNDAPRITGQTAASTPEEQGVTITLGMLTVLDPDDTYPTGFSLAVAPGAGYTLSGSTVTPAVDFNGTLQVSVVVNDGEADSATFQLAVAVTPVNDPPVVTGQAALSTPEDTPRTVLLGHLTVSDPDDAFPADFTLLLGDGADYTRVGNTVTPNLDFTGTLHVSAQVSDGAATSAPFDLVISVTGVNDAPLIVGQSPVVTDEDTAVTIGLADVVVDDSDSVYPTDFTLTVGDGASYTHVGNTVTPAANFSGTLTVPVLVSDGLAPSPSFDLLVTVTSINDPPVISGQAASPVHVAEDTSRTITLSDLTIVDPDDAAFTLTVADGAGYTHAGNTVTPAANYAGDLSVTVTVNDGEADSAAYAFQLVVDAVDDVPVITGQNAVSITEDTSRAVTLADLLVSDPDDTYPGAFTLSVGSGAGYTVSGATITPAANLSGTLIVPVTVNDGHADSLSFDLQVAVTPVNDAPVITGQTGAVTTNEDQTLTIIASMLQVSDPDDAWPADFTVTVQAGASYTTDGAVVTPAADFNGTLHVNVTVNDGAAGSAAFQLTVGVTAVNDAPVITAQGALSTPEETALTVSLASLTVVDPDNAWPADFALTLGTGTGYSLSGSTVTPDLDFNGVLHVPAQVSDGAATSAAYDLQITVTPINDAPLITSQHTVTIDEDSSITLAVTDLVIDDPDDTYPGGFTLTVADGAQYTRIGDEITPAANWHGTLTVPVAVSDGDAASAAYNLLVTVTSVPDAPIPGADDYATHGNTRLVVAAPGLLDNDSDPDSTFTIESHTAASHGEVVLQKDTGDVYTGAFAYTPAAGYVGTDSFSYTLKDGEGALTATATVTLTVSNRIWYVDPTLASNGDGRDTSPFNTLASAATASFATETIFVFEGAGPGLNGGIVLKNGQKLVGHGVGLVRPPNDAIAAGGQPMLACASSPCITVADDTTVAGLTIDAATGVGIASTGAVARVELHDLAVEDTAGAGISLTAGAALTLSRVQVRRTAGDALAVSGSAGATQSLTLNGCSLSTAGGRGLYVYRVPSLSVTTGATAAERTSVYAGNNTALYLDGVTAMSATFDTVSSLNDAGSAAGAPGLYLSACGGSLTAGATDVVMPKGHGVQIVNGKASDLNVALGDLTVDHPGQTSGWALWLATNPGAAISFRLMLDPVTVHGGGLYAHTSGTVTITTDDGAAPSLTANTSGALDLEATAGNVNGTSAWTFGTLTSSVYVKDLATPVAVGKVAIDCVAGLTSSPSPGISVTNHTASFTVGAAGGALASGGTIVDCARNIVLAGARDVSLYSLDVKNSNGHGIEVTDNTTVDNLLVRGCRLENLGSGSAYVADGIHAAMATASSTGRLTGTVTVTGSLIRLVSGNGIYLVNGGGTGTVTIHDTSIESPGYGTGVGNGILVRADGTAGAPTLTVNIDASTVTGVAQGSDAVNLAAEGTGAVAQLTTSISGSSLSSSSGLGDNAIRLAAAGRGRVTFAAEANTLTSWAGPVVSLAAGGVAADLRGHVGAPGRGNTIDASSALSYDSAGVDLLLDPDFTGDATTAVVRVSSNTISNTRGYGIIAVNRGDAGFGSSGTLDLTVDGNAVQSPLVAGFYRLFVRSSHTTSTCAALTGNTNAAGGSGILLQQVNTSTVRLPGYGGAATDVTAVQAFVSGNNTVPSVVATVAGAPGYVGGATCAPAP